MIGHAVDEEPQLAPRETIGALSGEVGPDHLRVEDPSERLRLEQAARPAPALGIRDVAVEADVDPLLRPPGVDGPLSSITQCSDGPQKASGAALCQLPVAGKIAVARPLILGNALLRYR